jgi:hypothetical protein
METNDTNIRRVPFPAVSASREFIGQMGVFLRAIVDGLVGGMIPKENVETFYHGRSFVYQQDDLSSHQGTFETRSAGDELDLESILSGDLQALPKFLEGLATNFDRQMKQLLFQRVGEAAESVGNTVDARQHKSIAEAYLEMFRKVEFGVDKEGNISRPELVLHPNTARRLQEELSKQGPEFRQAIQELTNQKIADALRRERERLSKFKSPDET